MKEGGELYSKVLNDAAHFIVAAGKEKFLSRTLRF
jgi:hypothetical protein